MFCEAWVSSWNEPRKKRPQKPPPPLLEKQIIEKTVTVTYEETTVTKRPKLDAEIADVTARAKSKRRGGGTKKK